MVSFQPWSECSITLYTLSLILVLFVLFGDLFGPVYAGGDSTAVIPVALLCVFEWPSVLLSLGVSSVSYHKPLFPGT